MSQLYICFPNWTYKAVTLSYDDGRISDRRLVSICNQYNLKATFHLCDSFLDQHKEGELPFISRKEVNTLYEGHEVSNHTLNHSTLTRSVCEHIVSEVVENRKSLEKLVAYPIKGLSYPNGVYNSHVTQILRALGIKYSRTCLASHRFHLPDDYLLWHPTCHHNDDILQKAETFLQVSYNQRLLLFYVWGHSYEFERDGDWEVIEAFAQKIGNRPDIWYATNLEIYDYMHKAALLECFADECGAYNPTDTIIWLTKGETRYQIGPGQTVFFE